MQVPSALKRSLADEKQLERTPKRIEEGFCGK
jgi:hypothetical protein